MKSVGLLVGVGMAGVFVGTMVTEIVHRVFPGKAKDEDEKEGETPEQSNNTELEEGKET